MKGGLHLLATHRADNELYIKQRNKLFDLVCNHGSDNCINPYDFLDMIDDLRKLMMAAIAESETVQ